MINSLKFKVEVIVALKLFTWNITANSNYLILLTFNIISSNVISIEFSPVFFKKGFRRFSFFTLLSYKYPPICLVLGLLGIANVSAPSAGLVRTASLYPRQNWILWWWKGKNKQHNCKIGIILKLLKKYWMNGVMLSTWNTYQHGLRNKH